MPGKKMPQIKKQYEALNDKGFNKEKAARIANTPDSEKRSGKSEKYENRTKSELYKETKQPKIMGRSKMSKKELIEA